LIASSGVTGWSGVRTGALWTYVDKAQGIDMRDAAAACADLDQIDGGHHDRASAAGLEAIHAIDFQHVGDGRSAAFDQACFGGGSTHVEREDIGMSGEPAIETGSEGSGRRSRLE
jgi:hypothetical protein